MTKPANNSAEPQQAQPDQRPPEQQPPPEQRPETAQQTTPLDMMIGGLRIFVDKLEKAEAEARAKAAERTQVPDDIPRFVTR